MKMKAHLNDNVMTSLNAMNTLTFTHLTKSCEDTLYFQIKDGFNWRKCEYNKQSNVTK